MTTIKGSKVHVLPIGVAGVDKRQETLLFSLDCTVCAGLYLLKTCFRGQLSEDPIGASENFINYKLCSTLVCFGLDLSLINKTLL